MDGEFRQMHARLEASLADVPRQLGREPKAILLISGHWEEKDFTVMGNPNPPMIYDYSGFPELAHRVLELLQAVGIVGTFDSKRGFDHGAFVPLSVMYPNANIPVVQLSLKNSYSPQQHLDAGRALAPLRDEDVLIVGSGLSYHNLRQFDARGRVPSHNFDDWLNETLTNTSPQARTQRLMEWKQAPAAREAHPHEDHLLPLMVVVGTAENEKAETIYHQDDFFGALAVSSFRLG
jgi:aromatic ring-opening dioxygenase catalytic subunit (LigB family)